MRLPLTMDIRERRVLCVGDSPRLASKAKRLAQAGGRLYWWRSLPRHSAGEDLPDIAEDWEEVDPDFLLVDVDDEAERRAWIERAEATRVWGWFKGEPEQSRLQFPSVVTRGPVRVAMDTAGMAPSVARWLRHRVEQLLPAGLGHILERVRTRRDVDSRLNTPHQRRSFWYRLLGSHQSHRAAMNSVEQTDAVIESTLAECEAGAPVGEVFLVGAGPGDPDLLTVKALRLLGEADVVLHDRLISEPIMELVRTDAECLPVGKARGHHRVPQERINQLLVEHARAGKTVLRLKGGDPFIFGRGGEELEALAEEGIDFQVVPGITAASGCATYAGIPLTHRDHAQSVRFVTGHLKNNQVDLPWADLVQDGQTLVVYMGLVGLSGMTRQLMAHGMSAKMPVAVVCRGTLPTQQVVAGTLSDIVGRVKASDVSSPSLVVIGTVVGLRRHLDWVDQQAGAARLEDVS